MPTCCPDPSPGPFPYVWNCGVTFTRSCADGTGVVIITIPPNYFAVKISDYSSEEAALLAVNAMAEALAEGRALNTVLTCNSLTPGDIADCGLAEERPVFTPGCNFLICTNTGNTLCTDANLPLAVT